MRISDEDLAEMVRDSYCKDAGCKRCNAVKDLRDLARAFLDLDSEQLRKIADSPAPFGNPFNCLISRVAVIDLADKLDALKTHLEEHD